MREGERIFSKYWLDKRINTEHTLKTNSKPFSHYFPTDLMSNVWTSVSDYARPFKTIYCAIVFADCRRLLAYIARSLVSLFPICLLSIDAPCSSYSRYLCTYTVDVSNDKFIRIHANSFIAQWNNKLRIFLGFEIPLKSECQQRFQSDRSNSASTFI